MLDNVDENIRLFLEYNIELIDSYNWEELFNRAQDYNEGLTNEDFSEFLNVLKQIDISFTSDQLEEYFIKTMKYMIDGYFDCLEEDEKFEGVSLEWYITHVPGNLFGHSPEYAEHLFEEKREELSIEIFDRDGDLYFRPNIFN